MTRPLPVPCRHAGCPATQREPWCPAHRPAAKDYHTATARRVYDGAQWKKLRAIVRRAQPLCQRCGRPSQQVHHKNGQLDDMRFDSADPFNSNLEALCRACHEALHGHARRAR
ncbi:MAG: HNH endonuclease [Gemmatimonadaceae bacterium]|nr:HNH endonuclease [Gemmatimonadaceae bacterium]